VLKQWIAEYGQYQPNAATFGWLCVETTRQTL